VKILKKKSAIKSDLLIKQRKIQIAIGASKVFRKKGYYKSTVREIAAASSLTPGNLYDYVDKKEDILFLVFREFHDLWVKAFNKVKIFEIADAAEQLSTAINVMCQVAEQNHEMAFLMYTESKSLPKKHLKTILLVESELIQHFTDILQKGIEQGIFECEDPELMGSLIVYLLNFKTLRGWTLKGKYSVEDLSSHITKRILKTISTHRRNSDATEEHTGLVEEGLGI